MKYLSKMDLYHHIDILRNEMLDYAEGPTINIQRYIANNKYFIWKKAHLRTPGCRGFSCRDMDNPFYYYIVTAPNMSDRATNFVLTHEFCHSVFDRFKFSKNSHHYYVENCRICEGPYLEWVCNEGAAELLVPYREFIPKYITWHMMDKIAGEPESTIPSIAKAFKVTESIIKNRIYNLQYEMWQYSYGTELNDIEILSQSKQKSRKIVVPDIDTIADAYYKLLYE